MRATNTFISVFVQDRKGSSKWSHTLDVLFLPAAECFIITQTIAIACKFKFKLNSPNSLSVKTFVMTSIMLYLSFCNWRFNNSKVMVTISAERLLLIQYLIFTWSAPGKPLKSNHISAITKVIVTLLFICTSDLRKSSEASGWLFF